MRYERLCSLFWLFLLGLFSSSKTVLAQSVISTHPAGETHVCYLSTEQGNARVSAPNAFLHGQRTPNGRLSAATAQFIVEYNGFPAEAQQAFQYAVDIWATQISSPVPIRIRANWVTLEPGALGSAYPATYRAGTDGVQKGYGYYPIALAEKIARRPINPDTEPDIIANINRNNDWYFGLDGIPALRYQYDFVTAVLHELAHGLGIIGFFDVKDGAGQYTAGLPSVYDHFIAKGAGDVLPWRAVASLTTLPNNSAALGTYLTSNNLYFDAPKTRRRLGVQRPFLAAPPVFNRAESLYHLNAEFYNDRQDNRLMLPRQREGDAIHAPGPILLSMLDDLEWRTTSVLHEPLTSTERITDLTFGLRVVSDTSRSVAAPRLLYRKTRPTRTDTAVTSVPLTQVGSLGEYQYTLPAAQAQGEVWYYLSAQDASGRTFTNPGKTPSNAQLFYRTLSGPDNVPPVIRHNPSRTLILPTRPDSLPILATIADDRPAGISSAVVEYQINGVAQPALPLSFAPTNIDGARYDSLYRTRLNFPANVLKPGDRITYRVVARDASQNRNQAVSPALGTHEIRVVAPQTARDRYINDFNDSGTLATDFALSGFTVTQPPEFGNPALHSAHPYQNGSDFRRQSSTDATLLVPIRIATNPDSAIIRFDEVALVQPGQVGSRFGQPGFTDYAVVEGSNDNGLTWRPLADGYNALDQSNWLAQYNRNLFDGTQFGERNSTSAGLPALFNRRTIPLLGASGFKAGETVLIRFRLFADAASAGWGWAIDNLRIQAPALPLVLANEPAPAIRFVVFPNPVSTGLLRVETDLIAPVKTAEINVLNVAGQVVWRESIRVGSLSVRHSLDISQLPAGVYVIRLVADGVVLTQRVTIAR